MQIRFKSLLNSDKQGFEFTGDSMSFWESAYRNGGVLNGAFGCYETYGDHDVQHSQLRACGVSEFTDFCVSLTQHMADHLSKLTDCSTHGFGFCNVSKETVLFLATVVYKEDKAQWFNLSECKVTTSKAKEFDKRWTRVPDYANGTIASAYHLYNLARDFKGTTYVFELYSRQFAFWDCLYSVASQGDWDKVTAWQNEIPGDHRQAFLALKAMVESLDRISYALRAAKSAIYNSTPREQVAA